MATVKGVWIWNDVLTYNAFGESGETVESVNFTSNGENFTTIIIDYYGVNSGSLAAPTYIYFEPGWVNFVHGGNIGGGNIVTQNINKTYKIIDFGETEQTVSKRFYDGLTANATQQASPSVPTPDWANCFVKTSAGNKAVEKVWIKQNGQLVTVYEWGGGVAVNFATDSWETISAACKDGSYKRVYKVGNTKDIELSTGETITVAIMGFDHDDLSDGSGKAPITVAMENLLATRYPMDSSQTNVGGWNESKMRTSTMAMLLSQLPFDLQSVIKQVNKKATAGGAITGITTSADKLWLLAEVEVDGTTTAGYADEGEQYEYWKTVKDGKTSTDRIKYLSNGTGSAQNWWLRSPNVDDRYDFRYFNSAGSVNHIYASAGCGVSFGFCIG